MLQDVYGLEGDRLWTAASGFGGGIGRCQSVCGAITGGAMGISLREGQRAEEPRTVGNAVRPAVRGLLEDFREKFGSIDCRTLTGFDFSAPNGHEDFVASGAKQTKCNKYVEHVVRTLAAP